MNQRIIYAFSSILIAALCCFTAQSSTSDSVVSKPDLAGKVATLQEYVSRCGRNQINTFYIANLRNDDGKKYWYAYWREGQSILLFEHFAPVDPGSGGYISYEWLDRKARIDLRTEVVPTKEEIGGSSFLEDKPWVDRIVSGCIARGQRYVIKRTARVAKPCT